MKNIIKPLAQCVLIPLGLTVAASAAGSRCRKKQKEILGYGTTTLITSNDEIEDTMKIVNLLKILFYCQKELVKQFQMK